MAAGISFERSLTLLFSWLRGRPLQKQARLIVRDTVGRHGSAAIQILARRWTSATDKREKQLLHLAIEEAHKPIYWTSDS